MIRVKGIVQPQYTGHLLHKKASESHPCRMPRGFKLDLQRLVEVWSALQLLCGVKGGDGSEMWLLHSCPPT